MLTRAGCGMGTLLRLADMADHVNTSHGEPRANHVSDSEVIRFLDSGSSPEAFIRNLNLALEGGLISLSEKVVL